MKALWDAIRCLVSAAETTSVETRVGGLEVYSLEIIKQELSGLRDTKNGYGPQTGRLSDHMHSENPLFPTGLPEHLKLSEWEVGSSFFGEANQPKRTNLKITDIGVPYRVHPDHSVMNFNKPSSCTQNFQTT